MLHIMPETFMELAPDLLVRPQIPIRFRVEYQLIRHSEYTQQLVVCHPKLWSERQFISRLRPRLALSRRIRCSPCV